MKSTLRLMHPATVLFTMTFLMFLFNETAAQKNSKSIKIGTYVSRVITLAYRMITFQFLLHQQVFCTGSASAIIAIVKDKLPQVAKDEGVTSMVSKWEVTCHDPSVEIVDLTMPVAKLFNPKGDFENMAKEIAFQNPVPIEEFNVEEVVQMWKQIESGTSLK